MGKKKCALFLIILFALFLCIFIFLLFYKNIKYSNLDDNTTTSLIYEENDYIENLKKININVLDNDGQPVSNLKVDIVNITGDSYYYTPDCFFTDSYGNAYCQVVPKTYKVIIKDTFNGEVYNEVIYEFVFDGNNYDYTFKWPFISPSSRKINFGNFIKLYFSYDRKNVINESVKILNGFFDLNDTWINNSPDSINLGFTDFNGMVLWENPVFGEFTVEIYLNKDGERRKILKHIYIDEKSKEFYIELN